MPIIIGALLALLCITVVLLPFLRGWQSPKRQISFDSLDGKIRDRERIYAAMRTLRMDYEMGNLEEAEFRAQLQSYRAQAATLLQELERTTTWEKLIEDEVLSLRKSPGSTDGTRLCLECNNSLEQEGLICPHCGAEFAEG